MTFSELGLAEPLLRALSAAEYTVPTPVHATVARGASCAAGVNRRNPRPVITATTTMQVPVRPEPERAALVELKTGARVARRRAQALGGERVMPRAMINFRHK